MWRCCDRSRYQGQGEVITSHTYYGMQLLIPAFDTCFWHNTPHKMFSFRQCQYMIHHEYSTPSLHEIVIFWSLRLRPFESTHLNMSPGKNVTDPFMPQQVILVTSSNTSCKYYARTSPVQLLTNSHGIDFMRYFVCEVHVKELGQHLCRDWLDAWRDEAITWTNVHWLSVRSCGTESNFRENVQDILPFY